LYDSTRKPYWNSGTYMGATNWRYCASKSFVKLVGTNFFFGSEKFVPVGFNAYWLGLDETYTYPSKYRIEEMFQVAQKMSATAIRAHTLGHSSGKSSSLRPYGNTLNAAAWNTIDYAFSMARKYNIRLITPLTDTYWWYNGISVFYFVH